MHALAVSFTASGPDGFLYAAAAIAFLIAAIVAYFVAPRAIWASLVALGLTLATLAHLIK